METQSEMEVQPDMATESADAPALDTAPEAAEEPTTETETPDPTPGLVARIEALEKRLSETDQLIRQARHQGYIDGRNESIENLTSQPPLWQHPDDGQASDDEPQILILDNLRPSVWS